MRSESIELNLALLPSLPAKTETQDKELPESSVGTRRTSYKNISPRAVPGASANRHSDPLSGPQYSATLVGKQPWSEIL